MAALNQSAKSWQNRTGSRIAEQIFDSRPEAETFVAACQAGTATPPRHGWPINLATAGERMLAELASGRVEEINGKFHARFTY